ncbi:type III secretion system effector phosphothreonine lyase EseH [Edwardsiella piscicida]|uniref:type III secretion system effector phosphothreonine lyase EseH n=1 Tax=Edwardsiella piscicida TaxID=1263550 RepID=UPI00370DA2BE
MPINRAALTLSLPPFQVGAPAGRPQMPPMNESLKSNFDTLHRQMRQMPLSHFTVEPNAPDYSGIRQSGFFALSQGFRLSNASDDFFIHARRKAPQYRGEFIGDKFHISVQEQQVAQAFQALSGLLFSEDSPIDKWKVTDMARVDQQSRVGEGAQFTLYVKPDRGDSQYSATALHKTRQFIASLESRLSEQGIIPGRVPESDVHPDSWRYISYRNELRSERGGGEMQSQALREEPFYRLMTE